MRFSGFSDRSSHRLRSFQDLLHKLIERSENAGPNILSQVIQQLRLSQIEITP